MALHRRHPPHRLRRLLHHQPQRHPRLHGIPQVGRVQRVKGNHWILEPQNDTDIRANLMRWSVEKGFIIKTLQKEDLSIEEAFQKLTK